MHGRRVHLETIFWGTAAYSDAFADFHHDVALWGSFIVHPTSDDEHD